MVRFLLPALFLVILICPCVRAGLTADQIMSRVAANQDRAVQQRRNYVYQQQIKVATRRTSGKLMREETAISEVTPTPGGNKKQLKSLVGQYWKKGAYIHFHGPDVPDHDSLDGQLVGDFRNDLTDDKSKDGLGKNLFPLTTDEQKNYRFKLDGETDVKGRPAYLISFSPKDKDLTWAGEAWIDKQEFQPIHVATKLSRRIPFLVRTVLGTDLPGLGFNVEYQRFDQGVWFPVSFGTEFRLRAVFFVNRDISLALSNSQFARATVDSSVRFEQPQ
ncbi:MAG: hypothetical protein WB676_27790 [Bryobacteraceae bacterium]